jgi:hypothetical protein
LAYSHETDGRAGLILFFVTKIKVPYMVVPKLDENEYVLKHQKPLTILSTTLLWLAS